MNKLKNYVFIFLAVLLLSGCETNINYTKTEKEVKDNKIINTLYNQIKGIENLPITVSLYTDGAGEKNSFTESDKLLYGIDARVSAGAVPIITEEQKTKLTSKGINNVSAYITVNDVEKNIQDNFGVTSINHANVNGCPNYIYDKDEKVYYIQDGCTSTIGSYIVSYIDSTTYIDNKYYVVVYAGLIENNTVYADFNKETIIKTLNNGDSYTIVEEQKEEFTKFEYTFKKNSDGDYVFETLKRI